MVYPQIEKLNDAGLIQRRPGIWSREPVENLKKKIAASDLMISDLDECMFPVITQGEAASLIFRRVIGERDVPGHRELGRNMGYNVIFLLAGSYYQKITGDIQNSRLILRFEKFARGIPIRYFQDAAESIKPAYFRGVPEAFGAFCSRGVPCGVISLGIDIVIRELLDYLEKSKGIEFAFFDCTCVAADENELFSGFVPGKTYLTNDAKKHRVRARCKEFSAARPLVIGHDRDDLMMFDEAREMGGTRIGFRPVPETYEYLDAAVFARDWRPLSALITESLD